MPNVSVTYTFSNGTAADATQVNQNYTDIINGTSDSTKDFSINALTVAGAASFGGNVTLGNLSGDDITFTGSLAATIPIKTNNSFDIGSSTLGLAGVYLGSAGGLTTRLVGGATGSSYSFTFPVSGGTSGYFLKTNGSGTTSWASVGGPEQASNYALTASVAASALTVALKGANGSDPSSTNSVDIAFRNATAATGTPSIVSCTSAVSVVVSSGSTLGHVSAVNQHLYVYAINNAGTVELAVCGSRLDEGSVHTTTAEGGAGAADSSTTLYSTNARVGVAIRLLGRLKSNQAAAGTWATAISEISLFPSSRNAQPRSEVWVYSNGATNYGSTNTKIRRFGTTGKSIGGAITYADSATDGGSFTINEDGIYSVHYSDRFTGVEIGGISVNSNQLTTSINSITLGHRRAVGISSGANDTLDVHTTLFLSAGDVLRAHTSGVAADGTDDCNHVRIIKIAD